MKIFKNKWMRLILGIVSIFAGFFMMLYPEDVKEIVIQGVGFVWFLEGVNEILTMLINQNKDG